MTVMSHPKKDSLMDRRTLFCDVDDTLLVHDISEYPAWRRTTISCNGREFVGVPHRKNILMLQKFYKLGYQIIVWSRTGESWAKAVVDKLELNPYVDHCLTKPDFYLDDKDVAEWIGPRVYREDF